MAGFVTEVLNSEEFLLSDGTGEITIRMDRSVILTPGNIVKVFIVSNNQINFKPVQLLVCTCGEELMSFYLDCMSAGKQQQQDVNPGNFMW